MQPRRKRPLLPRAYVIEMLRASSTASGIAAVAAAVCWTAPPAVAARCVPSRAIVALEGDDPNYRPGAPVRSSVGRGHLLVGVVRASRECTPIAGAKVELFQAAPNGRYSHNWAYRATTFTDRRGVYRFQSPIPGQHLEGRPHIHVYVSARGFIPLRASYTLRAGETRGRFDVVLPSKQ